MIRGRLAAACLMAGVVLPWAARADRLHLESGGVLDARRWWVDGDTLYYEGDAGTVGIPRQLVVRIEATPSSEPAPKKDSGLRKPTHPAPAGPKRTSPTSDLLRQGVGALERRDFETASDRFRRALDAGATESDAFVGLAASELALGRDPSALAAVLDGMLRHPRCAALHEILGDLRDREERVDEALAAWREAFRLDPSDRLREKVLLGEREMEAGRDYAFSAAAHFNLRFDGEVDHQLSAAILDFLEASWRDLTDAYRHAPSQPITVLLYPNRAFREVTLAGDNVAGLYDGKIRVPLGGLSRLDPRASALLRHELSHAVVHSKSRGGCPRWLQEGLAQRAEGRRPLDRDGQEVRSLLEGRDPATWEEAGFSYAAAFSLTRYLEEDRGFSALVELLDKLGSGAAFPEAFQAVYGDSYGAVCARWARHAREVGP